MVRHLRTRFAMSATFALSMAGSTQAWCQQIDQPEITSKQLVLLGTRRIAIESTAPVSASDSTASPALPSLCEATETPNDGQQATKPNINLGTFLASQPKIAASQDLPKPPVKAEVLPVDPSLEPNLVEQNPDFTTTRDQPQAYIDPTLCERLDRGFKCENPSMLDLANEPCGSCSTCRSGKSPPAICERIRKFRNRVHYIYERTLLGDARLFCERKFGSYVTTVMGAQIRAGKMEQLVLFKYDFEPNSSGLPTAKIKTSSLPRLHQIGKAMLTTGAPLIIEQSGSGELDTRRRMMVVNILASIGMATNPSSVISGNPIAIGQSGLEAEIQYRSRVIQAVRNSQAPASSNNGNSSTAPAVVAGGN